MFWAVMLCLGSLMLFLDCEKRAGSPAAQGFSAMMLNVILLQRCATAEKVQIARKTRQEQIVAQTVLDAISFFSRNYITPALTTTI